MAEIYAALFLVAISVMVIIGIRQYQIIKLRSGKNHIKKFYEDAIYLVATMILVVVFIFIAITAEFRNTGILNSRPLFMAIIFVIAIYATGRIAGWARQGYLREKLRKM